MRQYACIRGLLFILIWLALAGCGEEDECLTCPAQDSPPPAWITGDITLYFGQTQLELDIFHHGGAYMTVDSVTVGDSSCLVDTGYWLNESNPQWDVNFAESGDDYMYNSGDIATVRVYGNGTFSTCRLAVLDERDDELEWVSPALGVSITPDEDLSCIWHKLPPAQWYGIELRIRRNVNGGISWDNHYFYTFDTTYTFTPEVMGDSIDYLYVYVLPTSGPDPTSTRGNWTGDFAEGKLYSHGRYAYSRIYIRPTGELGASILTDGELPPSPAGDDIVQSVYNAYRFLYR